jgi:hypothetical protein
MKKRVTEMTITDKIETIDYAFTVQIAEDGSTKYSRMFDNALEAVAVYNSVVDHGFCVNERVAILVEPNGKVHSKVFPYPAGIPIR